jgi:tetratricopeptide (TPR) repeat protein
MVKRLSYRLLITLAVLFSLSVHGQTKAADNVLVLPFENTSGLPEFNWVGESLALSLSELLKVPGLNVVSNSERKTTQQRLRVPLTSLPSLATSLRIARESGATLLITGRYSIVPEQGDTTATINIVSRIIRVNEGSFLSEDLSDGRRITRDINLNDALGNLQTMQGQIAYQILYQRDKALPFSQNQLIEAASKVPPRAFEAYIKGLLSPPGETRENFFKNAMRIYAESTPDSSYADAALELGHMYLNQRRYPEAIDAFERVVSTVQQCKDNAAASNRPSLCNDESFAEASFYIGSIHWQRGNHEQALGVLRPLAEDLALTSVYNTLGAIAVTASRTEKRNEAAAAALLSEGIGLLKQAAESAPDDHAVQFNYGTALFWQGNHVDAAAQFRSVIAKSPRDGEAYYLLSKSLSILKDPTAGAVDDQARANLAANNRYANLERAWQSSGTVTDVKLRVDQPQRKDFVSVVLSSRRSVAAGRPAVSESENLLAQARRRYMDGNDDEAMTLLRRVLAGEPMSAESYLILGKIHLRRGDLDQAIGSFKTAIFWDSRQIDAHVSLGKIYFERGECMLVRTYSASAMEINSDNPEAIALQRQSERCSK